MRTVAFCEQDGYARRVLRRHWPDVWLYEDVRTLTAKRLKSDGITGIDLICGGFPCQDISCAGKGAGIGGSRSGLWSEYARLIREVRPRWVLAENVPALRSRGADKVLGDLEAAGYAAWPLVVGALHAGAPHRRQRAWILAHSARSGETSPSSAALAYAAERHDSTCEGSRGLSQQSRRIRGSLANPSESGRQTRRADRMGKKASSASPFAQRGQWNVEPDVGRVAHGVPARVDRLRCLGNAVVPQVVAMIGQAILDTDRAIHPIATHV